jgi:hypothetical protein
MWYIVANQLSVRCHHFRPVATLSVYETLSTTTRYILVPGSGTIVEYIWYNCAGSWTSTIECTGVHCTLASTIITGTIVVEYATVILNYCYQVLGVLVVSKSDGDPFAV